MLYASSLSRAGYAVLRGTPITQGQMRIAEDDFSRLQAREISPRDRLILKETRVEADVSGVVARVRVSQVFQNPYADRLETLYVFPLPENSAVDRYSFQVGERLIVGEVKRREEARRAYEQARDEGRKAALLEQERANVFTQSVANIPPNAEVTVHIEYVQPLGIEGENYVFRFPMVVGPRYIPGTPAERPNIGRGWARDTDRVPDASKITPEYLAPGMRNGNDVFIHVNLDAGMPIQDIVPVTHELLVEQTDETKAQISLKNQSTIADKDFLLEYRLASEDSVLASLTHRESEQSDGYLMLVLQPKWNVEPEEYASREVILLLDTSGSMTGPAISQLRIFAEAVLDNLNGQDTFRIIAFNDTPRPFRHAPVPATSDYVDAAKQFVRRLSAGGGTELLSALELALNSPRGEDARPRYLFLMTDALVGDDNSILQYLQRSDFADARVFPIAFGAAPNHYLLSRTAEIARGFAMQVTNQDNAPAIAKRFNEKTSKPYMTDIQLDWDGLTVRDLVPSRIPDLYAGQPLILMGRYDTPGSAMLKLRGNVAGQAVQLDLKLELPQQAADHDAIGTLWARQRISHIWNRNLGRETEEGREEITRLGLTHNLVTQYTSFIAVEKEIPDTAEGNLRSETIPSMLPEGMTESAVGQSRPIAQQSPSQNRPYAPNYQPPPSNMPTPGGGGGLGGGALGPVAALLAVGAAALTRRRRKLPGNVDQRPS